MVRGPLHPINRRHLDALTGEFGIWQHASGAAPDQAFGYCTDDVARALAVDLLHARELGWRAVRPSASRSLRFLRDAFDADSGRFRNFRGRDGSWDEEPASEDSQGRALLALSAAMGMFAEPPFAADARRLFAAALPLSGELHALRAVSSALLACDAALEADSLRGPLGTATLGAFERLAAALSDAFAPVALGSDWPWPEPVLTYENALLPRALLVAGRRLDDPALSRIGRAVLDWLVRVQTTSDGTFSPIGSDAWWERGSVRSRFDQQPIEATATMLACEAAFRDSGDGRDLVAFEAAYAWFLGANDVGVPVAIVETGGCHDGLTRDGVNLNQGAESTLMWLTALEHVRQVRHETARQPRARSERRLAAAVAGGAQ